MFILRWNANKIRYTGRPVSDSSQPPAILPPTSTSSRLSLAPQGIYARQDREPRTIGNSDSFFKIKQNLHQGISVNPHAHTPSTNDFQSTPTTQYTPALNAYQAISFDHYGSASTQRLVQSSNQYDSAPILPPVNTIQPLPVPQYAHTTYPRQNNEAVLSPLSRIANGMLYNRQFQQVHSVRPEPDNIWQQSQVSMLDHLQPQKQQISPPFNPGMFQFPPGAAVPALINFFFRQIPDPHESPDSSQLFASCSTCLKSYRTSKSSTNNQQATSISAICRSYKS